MWISPFHSVVVLVFRFYVAFYVVVSYVDVGMGLGLDFIWMWRDLRVMSEGWGFVLRRGGFLKDGMGYWS
jgi:hypothetical protein